ncbi:hypothetical protein FACS1894166_01310 [Bacilli bacterium]|nr:hypothetical protein FACS1894166_01310 [Bacilli bacterium]
MKELLIGIVGQIIIRDVAPNYKVDNIALFNRILTYVYDTTSKTISLNNISDNLSRFYKKKIHTNKIEEYLNIMADVFLLSKVKRFDISGKQILKTLDKYYAIDCGIRNAFANKNESNLP